MPQVGAFGQAGEPASRAIAAQGQPLGDVPVVQQTAKHLRQDALFVQELHEDLQVRHRNHLAASRRPNLQQRAAPEAERAERFSQIWVAQE